MGVVELINAQEEIAAHITRALSNYKKSKSKINKSYVDARLELLEADFNIFKLKHLEILQKVSVEEKRNLKYFKEDRYYNCEDEYLELKSLMNEFLFDYGNKSSVDTRQNQSHIVKTKLPPIEIPSFSGNYNDWTAFIELFNSIIHSNDTLSKIQKYHYLKAHLKGEAELLLKNLPLTEVNYEKALEVLSSRYDNKRVIAHTHITRLMNQKKLPSESARGIRELLDTTSECLSALNNMGVSTTNWDPIITYLIVTKFDNESHRLWEQNLGGIREIPTIKQLFDFMEMRFRSLEALNISNIKDNTNKVRQQIKSFKATSDPICVFCSKDHFIHNCKDFGKLNPEQRREIAKEKQLCFNCLIPKHSVRFCKQTSTCRICRRRHHSLLHSITPTDTQGVHTTQVDDKEEHVEDDTTQESHVAVFKAMTSVSQVLLATAIVKIEARDGSKHVLRALVDQGSQASFITSSAAQRLGLRKQHVYSTIRGVDPNVAMTSKEMVEFYLYSSYYDKPIAKVKAHVIKSLASVLPRKKISISFGEQLRQLSLADPAFTTPSGIDLLLGADIHAQILLEGLYKYDKIIAQNSLLGWLISGKVNGESIEHCEVLTMHSQLEIDELLQRFWQSEEIDGDVRKQTAKEIQCERIFEETHTRTESGRYIVALPFSSENDKQIGDSRSLAVKRLMSIERRFQKDNLLKNRYIDFMREYENLQHMERVPIKELHKPDVYYLPHHGVIREESTTTKLRVVFDGSAKTNTGTSLNEIMLIGPSLQRDIRDLFLRWRSHKICLVADIQRMYRQILVRKEDRDYQRILWREDPMSPILEYRLCTVTYGTSCAPYLAIKTLRQLANDERLKYPNAALVLERDFYTDDLLTGCDSESDAIILSKDLTALLQMGGFVLHKWGSNSIKVLNELYNCSDNQTQESRNINMEESFKALGIKWNPNSDVFELKLNFSDIYSKITKRSILSNIAKIYDPLGWLSPVVVVAKIFLQKLWLLGLSWDDELPNSYQLEWITYCNEVNNTNIIHLERWIGITTTNTRVEIHGFSDASNLAYAGVVYIRILNSDSTVFVKMVTAKTKVAPIKQLSIPRLELCGAVLTAKLLHRVKNCLNVSDDCVHGWTDSTIVLAWLQKHPNYWKTFVGNRVAEILNVTSSKQWHYVGTRENPADCASRGIIPSQLPEQELWWNGPQWLHLPTFTFPINEKHENDLLLEKKLAVFTCFENDLNEWIIVNYSNLMKLKRITAYCLRFITMCRKIVQRKNESSLKLFINIPKHLTTTELRLAMNCLIKISQNCYFSNELVNLSKGEYVSKKSALYFLRPFLDEYQIIRVGGRLKNAPIPHNVKYPIIISGKSHLAKLIVHQTHINTLHGGPLLMLNVIRSNYWITNVKSIVKKHVRNCITCIRHAPKFATQLMGNLPSARVTVAKPFSNSGVDFAGPCYLRTSKLRNSPSVKAYIAIFICTATKAIHLELVSELSTAAFIASFKRFTSRRGHCSHLYSDCGTNFIGANYELVRMLNKVKLTLPTELADILNSDGTEWHFIPPGSPHFGGLWEAGVRSVKHHINRVLGDTKLTFEEYTTLLTQIECCLNSRPISAMSDTVDDLTALTPGHFLVFGPPKIVPYESVIDIPINRLNRWQHIEHILQSFWKRWQQEYLTTMQNRYKWTTPEKSIKLNDLVIIKNECLPPSKWLLGRVINVYPGNDGIVRVVTVKTQHSIFKRPVTKLCLLPIDTS